LNVTAEQVCDALMQGKKNKIKVYSTPYLWTLVTHKILSTVHVVELFFNMFQTSKCNCHKYAKNKIISSIFMIYYSNKLSIFCRLFLVH
jgi:hypothetical protein